MFLIYILHTKIIFRKLNSNRRRRLVSRSCPRNTILESTFHPIPPRVAAPCISSEVGVTALEFLTPRSCHRLQQCKRTTTATVVRRREKTARREEEEIKGEREWRGEEEIREKSGEEKRRKDETRWEKTGRETRGGEKRGEESRKDEWMGTREKGEMCG